MKELIIVAFLTMNNGQQIHAAMESKVACVAFTKAIAVYVQSADCFSFQRNSM